jgi:uncharacterized protein (DUF1697 family)
MPRYIAFLRAVNVGGRTVKMDHLRRLFESFGLANVETFIASGNVVFDTPAADPRTLAETIGLGLREALGYEVTVFLRTAAELAAIAAREPFPPELLETAAALNVAFLEEPLDGEAERRLLTLTSDIDDFRIAGREMYWLCRRKQSDSRFSNAVLEKTVGRTSTIRTVSTIRKMAAKYQAKE